MGHCFDLVPLGFERRNQPQAREQRIEGRRTVSPRSFPCWEKLSGLCGSGLVSLGGSFRNVGEIRKALMAYKDRNNQRLIAGNEFRLRRQVRQDFLAHDEELC